MVQVKLDQDDRNNISSPEDEAAFTPQSIGPHEPQPTTPPNIGNPSTTAIIPETATDGSSGTLSEAANPIEPVSSTLLNTSGIDSSSPPIELSGGATKPEIHVANQPANQAAYEILATFDTPATVQSLLPQHSPDQHPSQPGTDITNTESNTPAPGASDSTASYSITSTQRVKSTSSLPFVSPSTFLRNPASATTATATATPAAVATTLGSIAPNLPLHPTNAGPETPLALEIPEIFSRPITTQSATSPQASIMTGSQAAESPSETDYHQLLGLRMIRRFLKIRTSYDVLPLSFRLIVLDNNLLIKKSLGILIQNAIVSAPLWDSQTSTFAGLLTATDYINVIQYYCLYPDEIGALDQFKLRNLRDIEAAIGVSPIEDVSVQPTKPLYQALRQMLQTRARRIPLVDIDEETGRESVISVITQYRILKFIAVNNEFNTVLLRKSLQELGIGTYKDIITLSMSNTVLDAVGLMVTHNISSIPIVDKNDRVLNVFEAVDIIPCIQGGKYEELSSSIGDALCKRADESPGIYTCSEDDRLDAIFDTIRKSRVHRLVVVDDEGALRGIISLSDILKYVLLTGEDSDELYSEQEDEEEIKRQYAIYNQLNINMQAQK